MEPVSQSQAAPIFPVDQPSFRPLCIHPPPRRCACAPARNEYMPSLVYKAVHNASATKPRFHCDMPSTDVVFCHNAPLFFHPFASSPPPHSTRTICRKKARCDRILPLCARGGMVDAHALGACAARRGGSSPSGRIRAFRLRVGTSGVWCAHFSFAGLLMLFSMPCSVIPNVG